LIFKPYKSAKNVIECLFEYFGLFLTSFIILFESLDVRVAIDYFIFCEILNLIFNAGNILFTLCSLCCCSLSKIRNGSDGRTVSDDESFSNDKILQDTGEIDIEMSEWGKIIVYVVRILRFFAIPIAYYLVVSSFS
jgi:hypothetical protein